MIISDYSMSRRLGTSLVNYVIEYGDMIIVVVEAKKQDMDQGAAQFYWWVLQQKVETWSECVYIVRFNVPELHERGIESRLGTNIETLSDNIWTIQTQHQSDQDRPGIITSLGSCL